MAPGKLVRKICGEKLFFILAYYYREYFMDTKGLIHALPIIKKDALILDVGGGDGALLNILFKQFPEVSITMIDTADEIGGGLESKYKKNIKIYPKRLLQEYNGPLPDYILIIDVIHHIPVNDREDFFKHLAIYIKKGVHVIIKDIEPGSFKAKLAFWTDYYISGDKKTAQISKMNIIDQIEIHSGKLIVEDTSVFVKDKPNFCFKIAKV